MSLLLSRDCSFYYFNILITFSFSDKAYLTILKHQYVFELLRPSIRDFARAPQGSRRTFAPDCRCVLSSFFHCVRRAPWRSPTSRLQVRPILLHCALIPNLQRGSVAVVHSKAPDLPSSYPPEIFLAVPQLCEASLSFNFYGFIPVDLPRKHQYLNMLYKKNNSGLMQKKSNDFKLPQLKRPQRDGDKAMSKTGIDSRGSARVRPASSTKVEDLEKKLFSKLDLYEGGSKKNTMKRGAKSIKQIDNECSTGTDSTPQGYQKMQKLMPALYKKFVESRKEGVPFENSLSSLKKVENPITQSQQLTKKQEFFQKTQERKQKQLTSFATEVQEGNSDSLLVPSQSYDMSEQEMQSIFSDFLKRENLDFPQTSTQQMEELGSSLVLCEKEIQKLKRAMEEMSDFVLEIGMNQLEGFEEDNEQ